MTIPTRTVPAVFLQFAKEWPSDDKGWTTSAALIPETAQKRLGSQIGTANITELMGYYASTGRSPMVGKPISSVLDLGYVVRFLVTDAAGTIKFMVNRQPTLCKVLWYGVVVGESRPVDGGNLAESTFQSAITKTWYCEDAKTQLARTRVCYSYYGATPIRIDRVLSFNEGLGGSTNVGGNRSATTTTIDGRSVYTFDRSTSCTVWTPRSALDYLLAAYARPQAAGIAGGTGLFGPAPAIGGLTWVIDWTSTPWVGAATARQPYLDPLDQDVLSLIDRIAGGDRGLTWDYDIVGDTATIRFISMSPVAISYGATGLLANPGITLDLRSNYFAENVSYTRDSTGFDYISVQGDRPLRHVTFRFPTDLIPDDSWTVASAAEDTESPDGLTGAWRTYRINPAWDPSNGAGGTTDPYIRGSISSLEDGLPNGVRGFLAGQPHDVLDLTTSLGIPAVYGVTSNRSGGEQGPVLLACTTANDATKAEDYSDRISIAVINSPPIITLGLTPSDSATIKGWYDGKGTNPVAFYLTMGVREAAPIQVAWVRETSAWPNGNPRVLCHRIHGATEVSRSNGVRMSVTTGGVINGNAAGTTTFQDNLSTLQQTLAILRARYEVEGGTVAWTERALIDSTTELGTMIENHALSDDLVTVNAVISEVSWNFRNSSTSYATTRPDFQPKA